MDNLFKLTQNDKLSALIFFQAFYPELTIEDLEFDEERAMFRLKKQEE